MKPLFYNGKKKIDTKCHIQHFRIIDRIHINLNHTK
jgi:hypothetical protein